MTCQGTEIEPRPTDHEPDRCHAGCGEDCPDAGTCWCGCRECLTGQDARYRHLFHTAGLDRPEELRELAQIHRERVRQGRIPPIIRGIV